LPAFTTRVVPRSLQRFFKLDGRRQQGPRGVRRNAAGERVHPEVVAVMKEVGIDLSKAEPQRLSLELARGRELAGHDGLR